jgi:hypothetical protein
MKNFIKNFLLLTIPCLLFIFILLELVFRFVIPAANKPDLLFDRKDQIIHFDTSKNRQGVFTVGKFAQQRGRWSVNNFGWNSPVNYKQEKDGKLRIAVIGDSFIESLMVDNTKTFPSLLRDFSSDSWEVYPFGISGAPLSQYLHMSRYASRYFDPDIFVLNIVYNDFDESLSSFSGNPYFKKLHVDSSRRVTETSPVPYKLPFHQRLLKRSALVRYMYDNLKLRSVLREKLKGTDTKNENINANVKVDPIAAKKDEIRLAVNYMFGKLRAENPGKRIILVMDGPRYDIYDNKLDRSNVVFLNQMIAKSAWDNQLEFLDLINVFAADYKVNKKEFNSKLDTHWDEYGHKVVADTLYRYIKSHRPLAPNAENENIHTPSSSHN